MNKEYCERIQISAMAVRDGESAPLSEQEISRHLESCAECRLVVEQQEQAAELLAGQSRRVFAQDVWPQLAVAVQANKAVPQQTASVLPFVVLCLFLLVHKTIEVLPSVTAGVIIKLAPVAVLVLFFSLLKQNPFQINENLRLQGDIK